MQLTLLLLVFLGPTAARGFQLQQLATASFFHANQHRSINKFGGVRPRVILFLESSSNQQDIRQHRGDPNENRDGVAASAPSLHRWPLLERPHERFIFAFFGLCATAIPRAIARFCFPAETASTTVALAETGVALTWASMILAISFLEAWVKFRAPFLRKHVAVDVGRHVFAALNAAELGLCGSFWAGRVHQCWRLSSGTAFNSFWKNAVYYRHPSFTLPVIVTVTLMAQLVWIAPRLYLRAKARIVEGFETSESLSEQEKRVFDDLRQEVDGASQLPSSRWHGVYALLELVKVGCLHLLVLLRWIEMAQ